MNEFEQSRRKLAKKDSEFRNLLKSVDGIIFEDEQEKFEKDLRKTKKETDKLLKDIDKTNKQVKENEKLIDKLYEKYVDRK